MSSGGSNYCYVAVSVNLSTKQITCTPDPSQCYWQTGPANLRWTFKDVPSQVASVVIQWQNPGPPYKSSPLASGMGTAPSSVGANLPDIITFGNNQVQGQFKYGVICLDSNGNVLAEKDPCAQNDPFPP